MEGFQAVIRRRELEPGVDFCLLELTTFQMEVLSARYPKELRELEQKIKHTHRIFEILATHYLIHQYTGTTVCMAYHPGGKPFLPDSKLEISVTHTKNLVGVAFSTTGPIGIDMEYLSERIDRISSRFMSDGEIQNTQHPAGIIHRMVYWTMKESMLKLQGDRHLDFRKQLVINNFDLSKTGETLAHIQDAENQSNCLNRFFIEGELVVSWSRHLKC